MAHPTSEEAKNGELADAQHMAPSFTGCLKARLLLEEAVIQQRFPACRFKRESTLWKASLGVRSGSIAATVCVTVLPTSGFPQQPPTLSVIGLIVPSGALDPLQASDELATAHSPDGVTVVLRPRWEGEEQPIWHVFAMGLLWVKLFVQATREEAPLPIKIDPGTDALVHTFPTSVHEGILCSSCNEPVIGIR